jgi:hypothetical protein
MTENNSHLMPETEGPLLCYEVTGHVTTEQYLDFLARVKANISTYGEFRLLLVYDDFQGWQEQAAEMDVSLYVEYGKYFKKFCLVGPPDKEIMSKMIASSMISGELKIFAKGQFAAALAWVKS